MYKSLLIAVMACCASQTMIGMEAAKAAGDAKPNFIFTNTTDKPVWISIASDGQYYTTEKEGGTFKVGNWQLFTLPLDITKKTRLALYLGDPTTRPADREISFDPGKKIAVLWNGKDFITKIEPRKKTTYIVLDTPTPKLTPQTGSLDWRTSDVPRKK